MADVEVYVNELWRICKDAGIDFAVAFAQWCDETGVGTSIYWQKALNPAGIGLLETWPPGQGIEDVSLPYKTGLEAARAHLVHLYFYAKGFPLPPELDANKHLDPRLEAARRAGYAGVARTIAGLAGKWAANPNYATQIAAHGNRAFPNLGQPPPAPGEAVVFGRVPHPPFQDKIIPNSQTTAWNDLGTRVPVGVCQHSMVGSLVGTDGYFRLPQPGGRLGLTDYGIGGSTDGANDGVIFRWNDPLGRRSGWANGSADGLEGDGPLFIRTYGVNGVNKNLISIERSDGGNTNTPMSAKQFASIVALTAYWFDYARVPWNKFPLNPSSGAVTHLLHKEFATKDCPFPPVYTRINELQDAVRGLLRQYQTATAPPVEPPKPTPPPEPVEPDHEEYPEGMTKETVTKLFGVLIRHNPDGTTKEFRFNPKGLVSNAWLARGRSERMYPAGKDWYVQMGPGTKKREIIQFQNGWVFTQANVDEPWVWL
jgi:hypothetical protein